MQGCKIAAQNRLHTQLTARHCPAVFLSRPNCHCKLETAEALSAAALCDLSKFDKYIFSPIFDVNTGKKALFESWGYDIMDSQYLKEEYCKQAQKKYADGDFTLGKIRLRAEDNHCNSFTP